MGNEINLVNDEIPAYKKKSKKKGLSRADHKHIYETVLLTRHLHYNSRDSEYVLPTKVCMICGRIDKTDQDESLWEKNSEVSVKPWMRWMKELSEKALSLPKWEADAWDKFAIKTNDDVKDVAQDIFIEPLYLTMTNEEVNEVIERVRRRVVEESGCTDL
jgi:hypothetical protein